MHCTTGREVLSTDSSVAKTIHADLKGIVKDEDVQFLSESAFADACCPGTPHDTSVEVIAALYRSLM